MVAYFRNLEDQIKRSARRDGENRQKEEKRQARRERRSPNQVTEKISFQRRNELFILVCYIFFTYCNKNLSILSEKEKSTK